MLKTRVITAIVALLVLGIVLFVLPQFATRLVILAIALAAAWEWSGFLALPGVISRLGYVLLLAAAIGLVNFYWLDSASARLVFEVAVAGWIAAFIWTFFYPTPVPAVLAWVAGVLVIVPVWLALDRLYIAGSAALVYVLLVVWFADIGAYFTGKRFGRVKLAPAISPGKTWEGVLGGLVAVALLSSAVSLWLDVGIVSLLPISLGMAVISVIGDLTVSMFKRNAGLKDSGSLFPGHGGVLDRIDSISAAAPLGALLLPLSSLTWPVS